MSADEYAPSIEYVRESFVHGATSQPDPRDREAGFDRFIARVKRDAAREALDGLAEQEARACDRGDLTLLALHIHASILACVERYARDHYPKETP